MYLKPIAVIFLIGCIRGTMCWDSEQLEVFDVVDEVKQNFYELLNISQDASSQEIRSAFRGLTLKLHPDKNLEVDTSEQFRNLVSVYEVLRSPTKRKYYDEVLVNGLPNWRSAVYYYRYARKLGMAETLIILLILMSIIQYAMKWAAYAEKVYNMQELLKRVNKKSKKGAKEELLETEIPKPSLLDLLPIQIVKLSWYIIISIPSAFVFLKNSTIQHIEEVRKEPEPEPEVVPKIKTVRKRNKFVVPEGPNFETQPTVGSGLSGSTSNAPPPMSGGLWTDDDLAELIRLVKKYPQGAPKRWESIAEALGRTVPEVTFMANKMKDNGYRIPGQEPDEEPVPVKVKQKTKKEIDTGDGVKNWSQVQQKALEEALVKYSKGRADRWERIAECVPEKTKEECMIRYRYLAETLRKQRNEEISETGDIEESKE